MNEGTRASISASELESLKQVCDNASRNWRMHDGRYDQHLSPSVVLRLIAEIERLQGPSFHVIEFRKAGWTIMHPLACRPDLFKCKVNRAAEVQITNAPKKLGRFRCDLTEAGQFTVGQAQG